MPRKTIYPFRLASSLNMSIMNAMVKRLFSIITICVFLLCSASVTSHARNSDGIAAVVNDRAITMSDVDDRVRLIMAASGIPNNSETRSRFEQQVINMLIDEQIKLQEADRLEIEVTEEEIDKGFATLAQQNNVPPEQFRKMIEGSGLRYETLAEQIRAEVAWGKVVASQVRPRVQVSDADIDAELDRLSRNIGEQQYLVSEIFLAVDSPDKEAEMRSSASKLAQQVVQTPDKFPAIARQFSQSAGAAKGGDLGWVQGTQVQAELEAALEGAQTGSVIGPVRTSSGYHILLLRNQRQLDEAGLPDRDAVMQALGTQRLARQARGYFQDLKSTSFIESRV